MTIPKKRNYGRYIVTAVMSLAISIVAISSTASLTQALPLSGILRGNDTNERQDRNAPPQRQQEQADRQMSSSRTVTESTSPTSTQQNQTATAPPVQAKPAQVVTEVPYQPSVVSQAAASTPVSVDTSAASRQLATVQASKTLIPSTYTSAKISTDSRDEFYRGSIAAALVGTILYLLSYVQVVWQAITKNSIPVRKTVTQ